MGKTTSNPFQGLTKRNTWGTSAAGDCVELTTQYFDAAGNVVFEDVHNYLADRPKPEPEPVPQVDPDAPVVEVPITGAQAGTEAGNVG